MIVLEFVGGPRDGDKIAAAHDAPLLWRFPIAPRVDFGTYDDPLPITFSALCYERRAYDRGVWKYDYVGVDEATVT